VLGAIGVLGTLTVNFPWLLGAVWVGAAGRDPAALARTLDLGADATVDLSATDDLTAGDLTAALRAAAGGPVDVVVDLVWGPAAVAALHACGPGGRHVQVGQAAAPAAKLASGPFRAGGADLLGFSSAHATVADRAMAYAALVDHAVAGRLTVPAERVPLADVGDAWHRVAQSAHRKLVLVP
ncbi:MAG: zinc-binding dehydrogenase, partial [Propionibacteriaceae bacterium]